MAPARRRLSNSQGTARLATRPRWRVPLHVFRRGQAPVPRATAVGCGRALPYLLGEVHRIRQDRWRRVGLWGAVLLSPLQPHEVADPQVSAGHWAIDFPAGVLKERGALNTGVLRAACCRPCLELGAECVPAAFGCFEAALPCDGVPVADRLLRQMRRQRRGPIPPVMESRMGDGW
ncbi:hypothetical protein TcBrA4_0040420 [Trypanosoma cruzi]|nr:hypothetical protein TcBrA4_0040420 [Trypanosoma cruzi]